MLHWWHPPSGRGVRTRISDDLLWLPYVHRPVYRGHRRHAILDEKIPFLHAPPLEEGEHERYGEFPLTESLSRCSSTACGRSKRAPPAARTACR